MSKKIYLVPHGDRGFGVDPLMNEKGVAQIQALVLPSDISMVVHGTGKRFYQIYETLKDRLPTGIPVMPSPFCGSADGLEKDQSIILTNGVTVTQDNYLGLVNAAKNGCFQPWKFLQSLLPNALLCAGGELMLALEQGIPQKGRLYELDVDAMTSRLVE